MTVHYIMYICGEKVGEFFYLISYALTIDFDDFLITHSHRTDNVSDNL